MIERSPDAWEHNQFKDTIVRAANVEMWAFQVSKEYPSTLNSAFSYYKSLTFYLQEQPTLLTDLLTVLIPRIDHARVVRTFRQIDHIPLIRSYLIAVQHVSAFHKQKFAMLIPFVSSTLRQWTMLTMIYWSKKKTTRHFVTLSIASTTSTISVLPRD